MKQGDLIVVRYGRDGEQLAVVGSTGLRVLVQKWLSNSRRWTKLVRVVPAEVLRFATTDDVKRFKPALDAQGRPA